MGLLSYCMNSQLINQTQERGQMVVTCSVQWVGHAVNKSSCIGVCSTPKEPAYYLGLNIT